VTHRENPLRVALVIRDLGIGGAERQVVRLATSAAAEGVDVTVVLLGGQRQHPLRAASASVPVELSPHSHWDPRGLLWLRQVLVRRHIDVAHSFLWPADALLTVVRATMPSLAMVASERGDRAPSLHGGARLFYDQAVTFRLADRVCANSRFGRDLLMGLGCDPAKIDVVPNGVDLHQIDTTPAADVRGECGWPADVPVVGTVSRLIGYKGVDVLLDAVALLRERRDVRCAIIGDGVAHGELAAQSARLGLTGTAVAFLGARVPGEAFAKSFDVAVLASTETSEHCSNSILEAMACGRPVVATRIAGNPELIDDGQTGILVPPRDPAALTAALDQLLADPSRSRVMGQRGRARVEAQFEARAIARRHIDLWRAVAAARHRSSR
jgi:glycosyltransferase involved in cell wall biosynthesis